jgi:hypothetical protein
MYVALDRMHLKRSSVLEMCRMYIALDRMHLKLSNFYEDTYIDWVSESDADKFVTNNPILKLHVNISLGFTKIAIFIILFKITHLRSEHDIHVLLKCRGALIFAVLYSSKHA